MWSWFIIQTRSDPCWLFGGVESQSALERKGQGHESPTWPTDGFLNAEYSKCICFAKYTGLEILQGGCWRAGVAGKYLKEDGSASCS